MQVQSRYVYIYICIYIYIYMYVLLIRLYKLILEGTGVQRYEGTKVRGYERARPTQAARSCAELARIPTFLVDLGYFH